MAGGESSGAKVDAMGGKTVRSSQPVQAPASSRLASRWQAATEW